MKKELISIVSIALLFLGQYGLLAQSVSDIEGNSYKTVKIGKQTWMAENLKTTKYNDGTAIPNVTDGDVWSALAPAYCWYNNNETDNKGVYGAMYNWYTVNTGKLCPKGWHVPSDAEWTTLTTFLGGESIAGGKLKETGTAHWLGPNRGATNKTGFYALPGGSRSGKLFAHKGFYGKWWSATEMVSFSMFTYDSKVEKGFPREKSDGLSVRCIKDL